MDINRLRYFRVLSETGSMRKAAELLRISPAALSKSMRLLCEETGLTLFVPQGRGLVITDSGKQFSQRISPLLDELDHALNPAQEHRRLNSRLAIGTFEVFSTYFMGQVLKDEFQDYEIHLQELIPGQMEEALASGSVDLAITYIPIPHPQLDFLKVTSLKMGLFWKGSTFDSHDLSEIPFAVPISPIQGSPTKVQGLDGWPEHRFPRFAKYQCAMMETALELCRQGLAAAYLPVFVVELHNKLVKDTYKLLEKPLPRGASSMQDVYLMKRKSSPEGPEAKKLARSLRLFIHQKTR